MLHIIGSVHNQGQWKSALRQVLFQTMDEPLNQQDWEALFDRLIHISLLVICNRLSISVIDIARQ